MPEQPSAPPGVRNKPDLLQTLYFAAPIFLGAFLLFLLEPLYAKLILPWFGGSASVWALCLVFFQSALLLGYAYADLISRRLTPRAQSILHAALLVACLPFLPITPNPHWRPQPNSDPTWSILGLLATQIGLPFVLLSATSPLIQSWYSRSQPHQKPYILFSLSNGASLLALLSFPFLIEPNLSSSSQVSLWSGLFVLFILLCSLAAWSRARGPILSKRETGIEPSRKKPPRPGEKLTWIGLSACGSMLLLAVTTHLTQDVAPMPLLWVLPLSLYLLTFILVFSREGLYPKKWYPYFLAAVLVFLNYLFYEPDFLPALWIKILALCASLFSACFFCHGELALRKPSPSHLTSYYLMISLGGALGALAVGLAAPHYFSSVTEYPLSLIFTALAAAWLAWGRSHFSRVFWGIITAFLALVLFQNTNVMKKESLAMLRNFYAPLRVAVKETPNGIKYLALCNGVVVHGKQFLEAHRSREGTAYYSADSGAAWAIRHERKGPQRVGLIGMGAGTLAVYGEKGDIYRFYEINPQVTEVASRFFSFLRESQAKIEIVPGDARLSLETEPPQNYDVLAVDAFSGDAVPVHLLTKEAFALYLHHLKPEGLLAFHTSNLYLDLAPVVQALANDIGYSVVCVKNEKDEEKLVDATEWVLAAKNKSVFEAPALKPYITETPLPKGFRVWTDDYNSLFSVFNE